jgi:hypothetical protein
MRRGNKLIIMALFLCILPPLLSLLAGWTEVIYVIVFLVLAIIAIAACDFLSSRKKKK